MSNDETREMKAPTESECLDAFRKHGVEPPSEYVWLLQHRTLGFDDFSQLEPWQFCGTGEILPLSKRWPDAGVKRFLIPFAREQGSDDLACFEFESGKVARVWHIHYNLGKPVYVEFYKEYPDVWEWLRSAINDSKIGFEIEQGSPRK
jgi:hypothetical protein